MLGAILALIIVYGIILMIKATRDTFLGEAYKASRNSAIVLLILIACIFYIYYTQDYITLQVYIN